MGNRNSSKKIHNSGARRLRNDTLTQTPVAEEHQTTVVKPRRVVKSSQIKATAVIEESPTRKKSTKRRHLRPGVAGLSSVEDYHHYGSDPHHHHYDNGHHHHHHDNDHHHHHYD